MSAKPIYFKGLNGMRAIAAMAVVVQHLIVELPLYGINYHLLGTQSDGSAINLDLGGYGVTIFFALSGFLITFLILKEKEVGKIDIKKFYLRRILRIWPLYFAYLLVVLIVISSWKRFEISTLWYYVLLSPHIPFVLGFSYPRLGHYWSLGVEEHFYLIWPWVCRLKNNRLLTVCISASAILIATRLVLHFNFPGTTFEAFLGTVRFQCMLFGAILAILLHQNTASIAFIAKPFVQLVCWIVFALITLNRIPYSVLGHEMVAILSCFIIAGQATNKGPINLENRFLNFLGKISFGIYVIHPILIRLFAKTLKDITSIEALNFFITATIIVGSTILLAHLSYQYLERPFLKVKEKKYSIIRSSKA